MTTIGDIYNFLDSIAPFKTQMDFDNAGLLIGDSDTAVKRVTLALDITSEVICEALESGSQLIISHHPVIFHPLKSISYNSIPYKLIKNGLSAICAHTNFDMAKGGVNDVLCEKIGLKDVKEICFDENGYICRMGTLEKPLSSPQLAELTASALNFKGVTFSGNSKNIKTVAVCGGAGDDYMEEAFIEADAFITGEVRHHNFILAVEMGKTVICAGHHATEAPSVEKLCRLLSERFPDVEFILTKTANPQQAIGG